MRLTIKHENLGYILGFFLLSALGQVYGQSNGEGFSADGFLEEASAVIEDFRPLLVCTEDSSCWEICHYVLAYGEGASVMTQAGPVSGIQYLCLHGRRDDGKPIFPLSDDGPLVPVTDSFPSQQNQDHRNQILGIIAQATRAKAQASNCPRGIPAAIWRRMLAGAWLDYRLQDEPSWTLICYTLLFEQLSVPPEEISERICQILNVLASPRPEIPLSCGRTHALYATAVCLNSPCSSLVPEKLNNGVRKRLNTALDGFLRNTTATFEEGVASSPTSIQKSDMIIHEYGHALEWIVEYLPTEELRKPEIIRAVRLLAGTLKIRKGFDLKGTTYGNTSHAVHALRMYLGKVRDVQLASESDERCPS